MSRAQFILSNDDVRDRVCQIVVGAPGGTRVLIQDPKRTIPQNSLLWLLLTEISRSVTHQERTYTPEEWKVLALHALGRELKFLPALDGRTFVPFGYSSSDLSKDEMSEMIEFLYCFAAQHGVVFTMPDSALPSQARRTETRTSQVRWPVGSSMPIKPEGPEPYTPLSPAALPPVPGQAEDMP